MHVPSHPLLAMSLSLDQNRHSFVAASVDAPLTIAPTITKPPQALLNAIHWRLQGIVRTMRPHQWVKNLFVLAPVVFAKNLATMPLIVQALSALAIFCLLASAVYTMNDLADMTVDRAHPIKQRRPIASGQLPKSMACVMIVTLVGTAWIAAGFFSFKLLACVASYFILNVAYSFVLKKVAYVDVCCIAAGFMLRVLAGGFATGVRISGFMLACTAFLALFLGFGKRRHELALAVGNFHQRKTLEAYSPRWLDTAIIATGFASVATYLAYSLDPVTQHFFGNGMLWLTTIHPLFGVVRFRMLIAARPGSDSPTEEMLRDVPFVLNLVAWMTEMVFCLYGLMPT